LSEAKNSNSGPTGLTEPEKEPSKEVQKQLSDMQKKFGNSISLGSDKYPSRVIPTGCLALDYALGTGGWPTRHIFGIFGPRDIGKSVLGLLAIANAQKMGMNCAWVAVEPNWSPAWAEKHGVDTSNVLVARPKTAEEAFDQTKMLVNSGAIDLLVFDSIGALSSSSETEEGGKARVGGNSALISHGVKAIAQSVYTNDVAVIMLNQIRDKMNARMPGVVDQPGGHVLEHLESAIIQLKRGSESVTVKINGDDVQIAQEVVATLVRTKLREGSRITARYMFYSAEVEGSPFGIDWLEDLIATSKRTGVIDQSGPYYNYDDKKYLGKKELGNFLTENPEKREEIRQKVLEKLNGK
jgi:recombination protein RecA